MSKSKKVNVKNVKKKIVKGLGELHGAIAYGSQSKQRDCRAWLRWLVTQC